MHKSAGLSLVAVLGMIVPAQSAVLQGKVTTQAGKALAKAIVKLTPLGVADTTQADGMYSITTTSGTLLPSVLPGSRDMSFKNGILEFSLRTATSVKVEIFDTKGNQLKTETMPSAERGVYRYDIARHAQGTQVLLVKVTVDKSVASFRYASVAGNGSASAASFTPLGAGLARVAAVTDSITVSASGYKSKTIATPSLDATVHVTLDTILSSDRWGGLNNPPIKSAGCGKALGVLPKSGTYKISTVSGRGEFILDIPTNYNKDNPYRLVFGNHCMGGTAARVAEAEKGSAGDDLSGFYSIKTMATKDNIQNIYVAMQGDAGGTWNAPNDYTFWSDVLNHVETNLCVDTTRRFVAGFSFGAMFSYALSLQFPERIRAVATYAPANWNFHQPTNRKIPIAYYQAHGTSDGTCRWINNDASKQGGKYCLMQHVQDNGCTGEPKIATGSTHVSTEFTGCKEGYPVKFGSFVGGHQATHTDPGTNYSWIEKETWEFFKRF